MLRNEDVGEAIRQLRGERSQGELARSAGVTRQAWNAYENGRRLPAPETWPRVLDALGTAEVELDRAIIAVWLDRIDPPPAGHVPAWRLRRQARAVDTELHRLLELLEG